MRHWWTVFNESHKQPFILLRTTRAASCELGKWYAWHSRTCSILASFQRRRLRAVQRTHHIVVKTREHFISGQCKPSETLNVLEGRLITASGQRTLGTKGVGAESRWQAIACRDLHNPVVYIGCALLWSSCKAPARPLYVHSHRKHHRQSKPVACALLPGISKCCRCGYVLCWRCVHDATYTHEGYD